MSGTSGAIGVFGLVGLFVLAVVIFVWFRVVMNTRRSPTMTWHRDAPRRGPVVGGTVFGDLMEDSREEEGERVAGRQEGTAVQGSTRDDNGA